MTTAFNNLSIPRRFPKGHIRGYGAIYASATTLTIPPGSCRDSTDSIDMILPVNTTLNSALLGLNGMDTGTVAVNAGYGIWQVSDSSNNPLNPTGLVMSLSYTAPVLTNLVSAGQGYDTCRLIDYWITDSSGHFINGYTTGNAQTKNRFWDSNIATAITAGAAQTLTAINCEVGCPVNTGILVYLDAEFIPNAAGDYAAFAHGGSTAAVSSLQRVVGQVTTKAASKSFKLIPLISTTHNQVQYANSAATGSTAVWVNGFEFSL